MPDTTDETKQQQEIDAELEKKIATLEATKEEIQQKQTTLEQTKAEVTDYEERKAALDKEVERVKNDIAQAKEERRKAEAKDNSFQEKLRNENFEAAKEKFFSKYEYKPEDRSKFLEAFKSFDSQAITSDLIYEDLVKAHVASNAKKYISLEEEVKTLKKNSGLLKENLSSSGFPSDTSPSAGEIELTEDEIRAAKWAHLPIERYKELKSKGKID